MSRIDEYANNLREQIDARIQTMEGGPLDGVEVISRGHVEEAFEAAIVPERDEHAADLVTPAEVVVDAVCDLCKQRVSLTLSIAAETRSVNGKQHIKLAGKASSAAHVCGQIAMPKGKGAPVAGQTEAWDLKDIVGDLPPEPAEDEPDVAPEDDPTVCPHPGCDRPVDHRGRHSKPKPVSGVGDDGPDPGTQSADGDPEGAGDPEEESGGEARPGWDGPGEDDDLLPDR